MLSLSHICTASAFALLLASCATTSAPSGTGTSSSGAQQTNGVSADTGLTLCGGQSVSNAPATNAEGQVRGYKPTANVNGVSLLVNPAPGSCLSSAFGQRNGRLHKGNDYQSKPAGPVVAAGNGVVVESGYRDDYGNYILIEHDNGVYTRYAHLSSTTNSAREGSRVSMGTRLGVMGNTASYRIPIHLHYEVLIGNYATPAASFGLEPVNILRRM